MSELVERVKAAIAEKMAPAIDARAPYAKVMFDMAARAAIEAMREITPEIDDMHPPFCKKRDFHQAWRAMIDKALS